MSHISTCNARENVADLIYVAKPPTHVHYYEQHLRMCICNIHNDNVYSVVYIYGIIYARAATSICITNSKCLHVTVKCVFTFCIHRFLNCTYKFL